MIRWIRSVIYAVAFCASAACVPFQTNDPGEAPGSQLAPYYVILQSDQTGLREVADDGVNTYLSFGVLVPQAMRFYDGNGRQLDAIVEGSLVGISGLKDSILIKLDRGASFVAVRPGATRAQSVPMNSSDAVARLKQRLISEGPAKQAMERAIEAVESSQKASSSASEVNTSWSRAGKIEAFPDWKSPAPRGLTPSIVLDGAGGREGYITFVDDTLQPVNAPLVIESFKKMMGSSSGVLLVSGITSAKADERSIDLARRRAEYVRNVFTSEGIKQERVTVTAVFRTDSHVRRDPKRPAETVSLTFLPDTDFSTQGSIGARPQ